MKKFQVYYKMEQQNKKKTKKRKKGKQTYLNRLLKIRKKEKN